MKICSICNRVSATDKDHIDCIQMRRVEMTEDEGLKKEKLDLTGKRDDLGAEIKAILEHITKERKDTAD